MKRAITVLFSMLMIISLFAGCAAKNGLIVRNDITEDDLDVFYIGMKQEQVEQALGLPHFTNSGQRFTEYTYNFDGGYIRIYFLGKVYQYNDMIKYGETYQPQAYMDESNENIGKIDPDKYLMEMRDDITESELAFIVEETTSAQLQDQLGAPKSIGHYVVDEEGDEEITCNAYQYEMADGYMFNVCYYGYGNIYRAWIENAEGEETKVLVETDMDR